MSTVQLIDIDPDAAAFAGARGALADLCTRSASEWVLLLMSPTTFVDVQGFDLLLAARDRCRALGSTLVVVGAPHSLVRIVDLLGLRDELLLADKLLDAAVLMRAADEVNAVLPSAVVPGPSAS